MPYLTALLFIIFSTVVLSNDINLTKTKLTDGFKRPWAIAQIPDSNLLLITEKNGTLKKYNMDSNQVTNIGGLPTIRSFGQGGFLDIAVSPEYKNDQSLYFTYSKINDKGEAATTLAKATFNGESISNWKDLLITDSFSDNGRHFGSRITFDNQGHVFFSVGDRGERDSSQNLSNHIGSIIRLNLDGSVPTDNPFVNDDKALDEIYSYGHRNPQGLFFEPRRQMLFSNEHGPRGGDEINIIVKGQNYGWPIVSHGKEYWGPLSVGVKHKEGMSDAIKYFVPSIAPSSLIVYQSDKRPDLQGTFFSGALVLQHLNHIKFDEDFNLVDETRYFEDDARIRDVLELQSGDLVYITDKGELNLIQLD